MTKLALLALALALAHAQFLGYEDSSLQSTACTPDGSKVKTCSVSVSPDPVVKGGSVAISIDATLGSTQTIEKIELKLGVFPLDTITLDSPVECSPGCSMNINYQTKAVTPTGDITVTAVPKISSGSSFGYVDVALKVVAPTEESLEAQPDLKPCSGEPAICKLVSDIFNPYPIKKGSSETVSIVVNCNKDVTIKAIDIKALGTTVIELEEDVNCKANTDCKLTASADVPNIPFISSINAQAVAVDPSGNVIGCYEGKMSLKLSEEDFY